VVIRGECVGLDLGLVTFNDCEIVQKSDPRAEPEKPPAKPADKPDTKPADKQDTGIKALIARLKGDDPAEQIRAAGDSGKMGEDAAPAAEALCEAATSRSQEVRQAALEALEKVRHDLYPHIVALVVKDTSRVTYACQEIGRMKEKGRPATKVLLWY